MKTYTNLEVYAPRVDNGYIYSPHPGNRVPLAYNHDVDVIYFGGRYIAAWNANAARGEGVPGQFNLVAYSDDYEHWSDPRPMFAGEYCLNPVDDDTQWQPAFTISKKGELFCAWCAHGRPHTYISKSKDGIYWENMVVETAPKALEGKVLGFPTNHGLTLPDGRMIFPCSLPYIFRTEDFDEAKHKSVTGHDFTFWVRDTEYSGLLISDDDGASWHWSEPIRAADWADFGEDAAFRGTPFPTTWEPMVFDQEDGMLGLIVRNSTTQDTPDRPDKPHQMLLYCQSSDRGESFGQALPVSLDTVCSRSFAVSGEVANGGLYMVNNDHWCRIPKPMSGDRFHLSLFVAPVPEPDLLLPGPVVQPLNGWCCYPNGFIKDGRLYLAGSYRGIMYGIVDAMPSFEKPFLMPRQSRDFLFDVDGAYVFQARACTVGLVLNRAATEAEEVTVRFRHQVSGYNGEAVTVLTVGGKVDRGFLLVARYDADSGRDVLAVQRPDGFEQIVAGVTQGTWSDIGVTLSRDAVCVDVNGETARVQMPGGLLRKVAFGGLYEPPAWTPYGEQAMFFRLEKASVSVSYADGGEG